MCGTKLILCLLWLPIQADGTAEGDAPPKISKWPIGEQTSYFTGPIDANGYIDYQTALNERLRQGIKPQDNAMVLICQAFGPDLVEQTIRAEYFQWLQVEPPPATGNYWVSMEQFADDRQLPANERQAFYESLEPAMEQPWSAKEFPMFADWLQRNEMPLAQITLAS